MWQLMSRACSQLTTVNVNAREIEACELHRDLAGCIQQKRPRSSRLTLGNSLVDHGHRRLQNAKGEAGVLDGAAKLREMVHQRSRWSPSPPATSA